MYDQFMKNAILLTKNQEYVSQKCEKSYFSTKYRISAQNRIRPSLTTARGTGAVTFLILLAITVAKCTQTHK